MLAREATKADIQAVRDRLREAKEQRQLDIQINQAIALVNRNHRRKKYDAERLSAGRTLSVKKTKDFIGCCIHCFTCVSWLTSRSKVGLF